VLDENAAQCEVTGHSPLAFMLIQCSLFAPSAIAGDFAAMENCQAVRLSMVFCEWLRRVVNLARSRAADGQAGCP
jgi:hypothetical protein